MDFKIEFALFAKIFQFITIQRISDYKFAKFQLKHPFVSSLPNDVTELIKDFYEHVYCVEKDCVYSLIQTHVVSVCLCTGEHKSDRGTRDGFTRRQLSERPVSTGKKIESRRSKTPMENGKSAEHGGSKGSNNKVWNVSTRVTTSPILARTSPAVSASMLVCFINTIGRKQTLFF